MDLRIEQTERKLHLTLKSQSLYILVQIRTEMTGLDGQDSASILCQHDVGLSWKKQSKSGTPRTAAAGKFWETKLRQK